MSSVSNYNQTVIETFRANGGHIPGRDSLLLLTTTGAKSGQPRVSPLAYTEDGDRYVILASKAGMPTNPDWYHNLRAHPDVTVEVGDRTIDAVAKPVTGAERDRIYARWAERYPQFREYQEKTTRVIPVIELEPRRA